MPDPNSDERLMLLTPPKFANAWGPDTLVRLPSTVTSIPIPLCSYEFLADAGLPALIRFLGGSTEVKITFCRLASGLSPVLSEETVGPPLPSEWSVYWVLGDQFFCNGSAWWCINERLGHIERIDIELDRPIQFANSSVAHFASAMLGAVSWSVNCDRSEEGWPSAVDCFKQELEMLDLASMDSDRDFWPTYLDFIRGEGPGPCAIKKGSRLEGEKALREGPW
jgi:hypothetical protein